MKGVVLTGHGGPEMLEWLLDQELWVLMAAPIIGIAVAQLILRVLGRGTSGATSDEYIRVFHDRHPRLPIVELPGKLLAGVSTIGQALATLKPP